MRAAAVQRCGLHADERVPASARSRHLFRLLAVAVAVTAAAAVAALPARADDTQPLAQPAQAVDQPNAAGAQEPDSSATANASATQTSGANVNINVKANDPGDAGAVAQSNDTSANASATTATDTAATTSGDAAAAATQANAQNVNATVRVASPGDNGAVMQSNTASAAADAASQARNGAASEIATATQQSARNVNVSVRVASPGDDDVVTQSNSAIASTGSAPAVNPAADPTITPNSRAAADNNATVDQSLAVCGPTCPAPATGTPTSTAPPVDDAPTSSEIRATNTNPSNVDVSVRVASPGVEADTVQSSIANAVAALTQGVDSLDLSVIVGGSNVLAGPGGSAPWIWDWTWTSGAAPTAPDAAPTSASSWIWSWTPAVTAGVVPAGAVPTVATPAASVPTAPPATAGHWVWSWTWTRGADWTTQISVDLPCSCTWSWTWSWIWPIAAAPAPAEPADQPVAAPADPQVVQSNTATATASAAAGLSVEQSILQTDPDTLSVEQGVAASSAVSADAAVVQTGAANTIVRVAGDLERAAQTNAADALAGASAQLEVSQAASQSQTATDDGALHTAATVQSVASSQQASATALATQVRAANTSTLVGDEPTADVGAIDQSNTVSAAAGANVSTDVTQSAAQYQAGAGADQTAELIQLAAGSQSGAANAQAAQADVANTNAVSIPVNAVSNPALSQRNTVAVAASVAETTLVSQAGIQSAEGRGVEWHESGTQTASVDQSGADASAAAVQSGHENTSGWNGLVRAALQQAPATEQAPTAELQGRLTLFMVQPAEPVLQDPYLRPFITPPDAVAAAPKAHTQLHVFGKRIVVVPQPLTIHRLAPGAAIAAARSAAAPKRRHAQQAADARPPARPFAPPRRPTASLGAGSAPPATGGAFGATSFPLKFAVPGVGRPQRQAPAPGLPVDTSPIERPG